MLKRDGNQSGSRRRRPASQGHPSRGGTTVGGGTGGRRPTRYHSPTPAPPAPASQGHPSRGGTTVGGGTGGRKPTRYKSPTPSLKRQRAQRRREQAVGAKRKRVARRRAAGRAFAALPKPGVAPDVGLQREKDDIKQKLDRAIAALPNPPKPTVEKSAGMPSPAAARNNAADEARRARVRATRTPKPDAESRAFRQNARPQAVKGFKEERARQPRLQRQAKHVRQKSDDARALHERLVREYEAGKINTKAEKDRASAQLKAAGFNVPADSISHVLGKGVAVGVDILEETTRPLHGIVASLRETAKGAPPGEVAKAAREGLANKRKDTFSDVLGDLGVKKGPVRSVAGFVADVLGDPTTYVTFGTASVARSAALKGAEQAAKRAAKAGFSDAGQAAVKRAAYKKILRAHEAAGKTNKGISVGIGRRGPRTSGKATAAISRKLGTSRGATAVRDRPLTQEVGSALRPDFRRRGVPQEANDAVQSAAAERRAAIDSGERRLEKSAEAFHRLGTSDQQKVLDAIESGSLKKLRAENPKLHAAAVRLRSDLRYINRVEQRAGVRAHSRKNYVPHVRRQDVELGANGGRGIRFSKAPRAPGAAKHRRVEATLAELRDTQPELFTEEVSRILAKRGTESVRAVARAHFERALAEGGRKLTRKSIGDLGEGEAVYHLAPASAGRGAGLRKVYPVEEHTGQAIKEVEDALATPSGAGKVYYHGTDAETAAKLMKNGGFNGTRRGVVWGGSEATAKQYGDTLVKIRVNPTHALDVRDPAYADVVYGAQTASAAEKAVRDAGYDALTDNSQGWVKVFNKDAVTVGNKGSSAQSGQYVILNERLTDEALQAAAPENIGNLHRRFRRLHGVYKTLLTMPMPSYHMRNLYGDTANAWYEQAAPELARNLQRSFRGMRELHRVRAGEGKLTVSGQGAPRGTTITINGQKTTHVAELRLAEKHGALNPGFSKDLHELLGTKPSRIGKLRNLGQYRENLVRYATWLGARDKGMSVREAAKRARELHFDYGDLTKTERQLRDLIPFYTFTARNTPLQAKKLVTRPGKIATYQKAIEESAKLAGLPDGWEQDLDDWQKLGIPLPMFGLTSAGSKLLALPGLPITDLNRLTLNPREQFFLTASMFTGLKSIPELITNYSLFFRGPIDDDGRLVAAPDWLHRLPDEFHKELGLEYVYDKGQGKKIWKYKAKWDYLLRQLPETKILFDLTSAGKNRKGQGTAEKLASLSGVRPITYNPLKSETDDLYEQQNAVRRRIGQLNDRNIYADSGNKEMDRLLKLQQKLKDRITKLKKRRRAAGEAVALPHERGGGGGYFGGVSEGSTKGYFDGVQQDSSKGYFDDLGD